MNSQSNTNDNARRVLVIANETCAGEELHDLISARAARGAGEHSVLVVAPALNSRIRHIFSDLDAAWRAADARLGDCVQRLRRHGISAAGHVGDEDPLRAIEDALQTFRADELIISTHTADRSNWMARDIVARAAERFSLPISHVEVDVSGRAAAVHPAAA